MCSCAHLVSFSGSVLLLFCNITDDNVEKGHRKPEERIFRASTGHSWQCKTYTNPWFIQDSAATAGKETIHQKASSPEDYFYPPMDLKVMSVSLPLQGEEVIGLRHQNGEQIDSSGPLMFPSKQ